MAANKWMTRLQKHETARKMEYNPFAHVIRYSSPYLNWVFGNTHGIPLGKKIAVWGPDKAGKTATCYDLIGNIHREDPDAICVRYDTEVRDDVQLTPAMAAAFGIDMDRYICYLGNEPEKIFDHINNEIRAMCQDGAPIRAIFIDSITGIIGRRAMNAEGIMTQQIGDDAKTQADGLKMILGTLHQNKIALILTAQARANLDPQTAKYVPYKMAGAWYLKHYVEYTLKLEPAGGEFKNKTLSGAELVDDSLTDVLGKSDKIGHRIRATMENSSCGPKGRKAEFTFSYREGVINRHEEAFQLAITRGIVDRPNNTTYVMPDFPKGTGKDMSWRGKAVFLKAVEDNTDLYQQIIERVREQDIDLQEKGANSRFYMPEESEGSPEPLTAD